MHLHYEHVSKFFVFTCNNLQYEIQVHHSPRTTFIRAFYFEVQAIRITHTILVWGKSYPLIGGLPIWPAVNTKEKRARAFIDKCPQTNEYHDLVEIRRFSSTNSVASFIFQKKTQNSKENHIIIYSSRTFEIFTIDNVEAFLSIFFSYNYYAKWTWKTKRP